jgi:UDP-N-acetylglucosamine--N-acetylmuramyl-(pentapeptide) pyrophosphoryl-undecaprenol N-acetylglucosamine transferase
MKQSKNIVNQISSNRSGIFIIAGGGTGGHIFPAIAIANAIKKIIPTAQFLFIGAKGKMEMEKVPQAGYKIVGLDIAGFNRSSLLKNITLPFKIVKSFFQVASIFKKHQVLAVIGVGGYSSYPVLKYAQQKGIATFIHESNSFAGKSNIMLGKNATAVFTASDNMQQFFPSNKIVITGNPVRQNISNSVVSKTEALTFFNLNQNKKTVLVIGGSLGAKSINEAVHSGINEFETNNLQLIWQTGKPYFETAKQAVASKRNIYVSDFIAQMQMAYAAADVVISRSGAMAVAELCLVAKPVIFVPYPFAAEDHQTVNAKALVNKNAALLITDANAATELVPALLSLTKNEDLQNSLKQNIIKLAVKNADEIIAQKIVENLNLVQIS